MLSLLLVEEPRRLFDENEGDKDCKEEQVSKCKSFLFTVLSCKVKIN